MAKARSQFVRSFLLAGHLLSINLPGAAKP